MASAVMICFLWKSLQEKREYDSLRASSSTTTRTRKRAAKSRGAEEKEIFFPRPSHSRPLSRGALARLLETFPNRELARKVLVTAHREQTALTVVCTSQCLQTAILKKKKKKNYYVINSFRWINMFRVRICKLLTFFWSYRVLT